MSAELSTLETRVVELIQADTYFDGITVLATGKDPVSMAAQVRAVSSGNNTDGKTGVCVVVGVVGASKMIGRPPEVTADVVAAVIEVPSINNSGLAAIDIVPRVLLAVHDQLVSESATRGSLDMIVSVDPAFELVNDPQGQLYGIAGAVIFHVNFSARLVLRGS